MKKNSAIISLWRSRFTLGSRVVIIGFTLILACSARTTINYDLLSSEIKKYFGSDQAISPYLWAIYKYGLPMQTNEKNVTEIKELFCWDYPQVSERWDWKDCSMLFYSPAEVCFSYMPPNAPFGELQICQIDTCTQPDYFCMEFTVDGIMAHNNQTCYRVDILERYKNKPFYLFTSPPIIGSKGLRAVKVMAFIDWKNLKNKKNESTQIILVAKDFLSGEKRAAVFQVGNSRNSNR